MQSILREKLFLQANKLAEISKIYKTESHRFVQAYIEWIENAEKDLAPLRSNISILLQSEKSMLISVMDGLVPSNITNGQNARKIQRAAAAQSLEKISNAIYSKIEIIDNSFEPLKEKLCNIVAVISSKDVNIIPSLQLNQTSVDMLWGALARFPETIPMYNYFSAKVPYTDRNYLLMDIIQNIISNRPTNIY